MARVHGPLHSDTAQGSIGRQLTYRRGRHATTVVRYSFPGQRTQTTPTAAQLAVRARTKEIMAAWKSAGAVNRATWAEPAQGANIPPGAFFQRFNFKRMSEGHSLSLIYPPPPPAPAYRPVLAGSPAPEPSLPRRLRPPTRLLQLPGMAKEHANQRILDPPQHATPLRA